MDKRNMRTVFSLYISAMVSASIIPSSSIGSAQTAGSSNMPAAMAEALQGLGKDGWTIPKVPATLPANAPHGAITPVAYNDSVAINPQQLQKLIAYTLLSPLTVPMYPIVAVRLGLTRGDAPFEMKQYYVNDGKMSHFFCVPIDENTDRLVLAIMNQTDMQLVVTDRAGHALPTSTAVTYPRGGSPSNMSWADAQALYEKEIVFWVNRANTF